MAVTFGGIPLIVQNGGGSWQDIGGGQGSSSSTISFVSGTSSQARKFSGIRGMEWSLGTAQNYSDKLVFIRYQLVGGFAATRAAGGGRIVVNGTGFYNVAGSDTYVAGYQIVVADLSVSPTSGSFTNTAVTTIGLEVNAAGGSGGDPNFYIDELLVVDNAGISATGDTTTLIADFIDFDANNRYGIVDSANGIAISRAALLLVPNATGIESTDELISFSDPVYYDGTNLSSALSKNGLDVTGSNGSTFTRATFLAAADPDITGTSLNQNANFIGTQPDEFIDCTFTGFNGTNNFSTLGSLEGCSFNNCATITANSTFDSCFFRNQSGQSAVSVSSSTLNNVTNSSFSKNATPAGHALNITLGVSGTYNLNWSCTATGYDSGSTGSPATYTNTGNEVIKVTPFQSGTILNVNVADGATIPSINRDSSFVTVNVIAGQRTLTITVIDANTKNPIQGARVYITAASGGSIPQGTVIIDKVLTDSSGQATDQRSYSADQPITGVVRFASTQPYYKTAEITATVSSTTDTNLTVAMISDE